jgi:hypothetical protein
MRRRRDEWTQVVEEFERSGLSHEAFCAQQRLNVGSFRGWLYRLYNESARGKVARANAAVVRPLASHAAMACAASSFVPRPDCAIALQRAFQALGRVRSGGQIAGPPESRSGLPRDRCGVHLVQRFLDKGRVNAGTRRGRTGPPTLSCLAKVPGNWGSLRTGVPCSLAPCMRKWLVGRRKRPGSSCLRISPRRW